MQWSQEVHAGFSSRANSSTWLPVHPDYMQVNVEVKLRSWRADLWTRESLRSG